MELGEPEGGVIGTVRTDDDALGTRERAGYRVPGARCPVPGARLPMVSSPDEHSWIANAECIWALTPLFTARHGGRQHP